MRRRDREIADRAEMEAILEEAPVCRVAMANGDEPYVVPLCFCYRDNAIWIHSAQEGKKIDMIQKNPRCCVEVDITGGPIPDQKPCSWEFRYRSVICTGTARIVENPEKKRRALNCLMQRYGGEEYPFMDKELDRVCVIKITILEMTGKQHGY
jgi:uncharacterized protein